ncbi:hypothetical protein DU508_05270 [Pedobacter chinensis]|uniref:Uncharacterized protein n=1 Tax=Pedobacter chinensis TaxID=2282421 RepID=A0A369Q0S5_9SPHI|nr:hypothetical protein [Pedobacter chinensis]RDC58344.1 hypothetical protein DU508_05270 [Pedobacter chinensis]
MATNAKEIKTNNILNPLNIHELKPMIFYSGKDDELSIVLQEFNHGDLIIKSLSTDVLQVKELILEDEDVEVSWKQSRKGLRVTLPDGFVNSDERKKCTLKIKF